jgi:sugar phosphate isomerase/epimerase
VLAAGTLTVEGDVPLATAVEAAVAGGFAGISLWASTYLAEVAAGAEPAALRGALAEAGLVVDHVEAAIAWAGPGDPGAPYAEEAVAEQVMAAAVGLGCPLITALLFGPRDVGTDQAAEAFSSLAARAAEHGLATALEFAPGSVAPDLATALAVTGAAPTGGVLVDTFHARYGGTTTADLAAAPGDRILAVQVSDGPTERPRPYAEATRHRRLVPGEGTADLAATVAALRQAGCRVPLTVEVFSDQLAVELGPVAFARRVAAAVRPLAG